MVNLSIIFYFILIYYGLTHDWFDNAYKAMMEGVSPQCGIEQIRENGIGPRPIPKADNTWLEKDSFLSQVIFLRQINIRYKNQFILYNVKYLPYSLTVSILILAFLNWKINSFDSKFITNQIFFLIFSIKN